MLVRAVGAALSHEEAARRQGIALVDDSGRCCVTVPRDWSHVVFEGWSVYRRDLLAREIGSCRTAPA